MARISNVVLAIFNCITLVIGLGAMATGLYFVLEDHSDAACRDGLQNPLLIAGAALTVISLLGLIGSCFRVKFVLIIYLAVMVFLIVALVVFTLFTVLVTSEGAGRVFERIRVLDFQNWLTKRFSDGKTWAGIRSCLIDAKVCRNPGDQVAQKLANLYQKHLFPIQVGCCKPPTSCGFVQQNATFWTSPRAASASRSSDCKTWSNSPKKLCYDCQSCKAGFVDSIRRQWGYLAIVNASAIVLAILVFSIGCCAKRNNKEDANYRRIIGHA